ncbi:family 65 glycosyl hydrolase domain-containing protein [Roseivirga sp. E12]|uniref:family 65 glycosyl hydrolase domain-containing protein n=1 Tax=Roseivirga sp. E12 TaxID=2819237 RepID=UPI001ABC5D3A|nr:family 65 glycosyl hydrolase domain-containing protein [Roseivirga sp. E12]MBO3697497.1 glycoside hydrolase family 65 protein [Roseivirga sp. E12]
MKSYIKHDPWSIIEEGFVPEYNRISESIFSIGNGMFGGRANFEEQYSGDTLQGNYVAGVYYPDKTRVGWWKNGYPEYFAKVLNAANWIGINIEFDGEALDLHTAEVSDFRRELNMKEGYLQRSFTATLPSGKSVSVITTRFNSMVRNRIGAIAYQVTPLNFSSEAKVTPYVDFDVVNADSNYDEKFWVEQSKNANPDFSYIVASTKKTDFWVATGMSFEIEGAWSSNGRSTADRDKYLEVTETGNVSEGQAFTIYKYAANISSMNFEKGMLAKECQLQVESAMSTGFDALMDEQKAAWIESWKKSDITIDGDVSSQQGIRFNIFQLNQTYTGKDERLNIGPKGFTGEKYGGSTYWDTEAYCLPFYLATSDQEVARNLVMYRYKHLGRAIENAEKLGFTNGAALYPMVTMNGEECHNEWEITFEEIHRNGAIAYAIFDYINYHGDNEYLVDYGLEVLIGISRFWAQRVQWSKAKEQYVMLGVTGPNEYENNVNNNWYTSKMALWTLNYTLEGLEQFRDNPKLATLLEKINFKGAEETEKWEHILDNMYLGYDEELGVFLQQDGFLDKELIKTDDMNPEDRPINQKWSWDRILRSCYIKQADTLQGVYLFEDEFDIETIEKNFDFYEPLTVHESSLSPCVHGILASKLGRKEKAYEMYIRTARLDLDDYNNDTEDGCHTTSMAGTWMAFAKGFAGMRVRDGELYFSPSLPDQWDGYSFKIKFRERNLKISASKTAVTIKNGSTVSLDLYVFDKKHSLAGNSEISIDMP